MQNIKKDGCLFPYMNSNSKPVVSSVRTPDSWLRSSSDYHSLLHTYIPDIPAAHPLFQICQIWSNTANICAFVIHIHFYSVFNLQNRTRQFFCMNYIDNACMHKFIQNSTRFFRFLQDPTCAIFSKCMRLKVIKYYIPLYHEGHKGLCISLHFS